MVSGQSLLESKNFSCLIKARENKSKTSRACFYSSCRYCKDDKILWESAAYLSKLEFGIEDGIFIRSYIMNLKKDNMDLKKDIMDLKKDIMDLKTYIINLKKHIRNLRKDIINLRKYIYIQAIKTF